ncbi:unnamed protein product, partial [Mesorhabditis belari]|uniref:ZP domain-containing protein n=1 Tax=Mesorhabditis belari TaxID=2138241 RepID=A0AAF3EZH3_9BILA
MRLHLNPSIPFGGHVYVKGYFSTPKSCHLNYCKSPVASPFYIHIPYLGDCLVNSQRLSNPQGINHQVTIVVQHHHFFVTAGDRAYRLNCFYEERSMTLKQQVNVNEIQPTNLDGHQGSLCHYDVLNGNVNGPKIELASIGDPIVHRWTCDSDDTGFLVHSCVVKDQAGKDFPLIDDRGCPIDRSLVPSLQYSSDFRTVHTTINAFRFADQLMVHFSCQLTLCERNDNGCEGIVPPTCNPIPLDAPFKATFRNANEKFEEIQRPHFRMEPMNQREFYQTIGSTNLDNVHGGLDYNSHEEHQQRVSHDFPTYQYRISRMIHGESEKGKKLINDLINEYENLGENDSFVTTTIKARGIINESLSKEAHRLPRNLEEMRKNIIVDVSSGQANGAPPSECGSEGSSTGITGAFMNRSDNPPSRFRGSDKRESFTTCIIVAPSTTSAPPTPNFMNTQPSTSTQQQKIPARKQISVGAEGSHYACGDIVLNVSEGQFFVPENGIIQNGDRSPAGKSNHSVFDYGSSSGYSTSECSRESDSNVEPLIDMFPHFPPKNHS